ncbi:hypothetical protein [Clostridium intestinale]|uniref:hypothetical protein n=1 Tax=Clostridium intestinale TaxID=36845 RepID=UPI002DD64FFA|nr:hypothetical protein [Clostridium intestinale]WRY49495.1 hypothetical protein P8F83_12240 [Clostridium intestinale]
MNIKQLKEIIKDLDDDMEVIVKDEENEYYDCWSSVVNIGDIKILQITKESDLNEDYVAGEILERFNRENISYSIDPGTGEINYFSDVDLRRGEKIIKEIEEEYCREE